jgi:hypothetical protein
MTNKGSTSSQIRLGMVPCPVCKNVPYRRKDCKACIPEGGDVPAGMMPVDKAIALQHFLGLADTDKDIES